MALSVRPISFRAACTFVAEHHRHNKPPRGHKFSISAYADDILVGVAMIGRPVSRVYDDGLTFEVNRTCTDGTRNANSLLYGAAWRSAKGMGYLRGCTYTQDEESGASLKAAGWINVARRAAREGWAESTKDPVLRAMRDDVGNGGVDRLLWVIGAWPA